MPRPAADAVRRVAVIGAGTIGASWAAYFLSRGIEVAVSDPAPDAEAKTAAMIDAAWPVLERLGLSAHADRARWRFTADPADAAAGAEFVQENAPERVAIKIELYERLEAAVDDDVVICSSTSGLLMTELQYGRRRPERFVVGHPFNPPHLVPLVEVVGGKKTAPDVIDWTMAFWRHAGKHPIHIRRELPGHVANRLQAALWREAVSLVAEGVASVADVDAAVAYGPGLRWAVMGPHMIFHLGGGAGGMAQFVEHFGPPMQRWWKDMKDPVLSEDVVRALIGGLAEEAGGRSPVALAAERDDKLIAILKALKGGETP